MNLYTIDTGYFKLDGGAMFGVVPKQLWGKLNPPDARNMCTWAMRCLLVESGDRLVLIDTGIGTKQSAKFRSHFEPHGEANLVDSIKNRGFTPDDITDVLLTHLHFDHCGGAVDADADGKPVFPFKNARYWSSSDHWQWANDPNPREKASFLQENLRPIQESGRLHFTEDSDLGIEGLSVEYVYGHTEAMMVCHLDGFKGRNFTYTADLIPSRHHIRMPYVMSYDVRPLETMKEKASFLKRAISEDRILILEHDVDIECVDLKETERGIIFDSMFKLEDV